MEMLGADCFTGGKIIITGDLNINLLKESPAIESFITDLQSMSFIPVITKPTRFPPHNSNILPSAIDHIWINSLQQYSSGIISTDISDHCPNFIHLPCAIQNSDRIKITFRSHNDTNINSYLHDLSLVDWDSVLVGDVHEKTLKFSETVNKLYCRNFPLKIKYISVKRLHKPWLSSALLKSIKIKSYNFKLLKLGLIAPNYNTAYKNKLTTVLRAAKVAYYKTAFTNCRKDMRKTWKVIRSALGQRGKNNNIKNLLVNGIELSDEVDIAEAFNSFFVDVGRQLDNNIPVSDVSPLYNITANMQSSFFVNPVSACEVSGVIDKLKKTGCNKNTIPVSLLVCAKSILSVPISNLINSSFSNGKFPDILKIAEVIPIYKTGAPNNVSNFRPISLLSPLSKIFEKCMVTRIMDFLVKFSILSPVQFGFQSKKCTSDAVVKLVESIYESFNNKSHALSIFVDFKKAFDIVNHKILIRKLQAYGIRGLPLNWFENYLENRKQYVRIGSSHSNTKSINIGIPQGSVIGPIMFILYINDLPNVSKLFSSVLFADDTTFTIFDNNYDNLIRSTNSELDKIKEWTIASRLSLNLNKTHAMLFTNRPHDITDQEIIFNAVPLDKCNKTKFLGVTLDNKLKFDHHISETCKKISKSIGILYKLKHCVPGDVLINLYYSLVYPYLLYCNIVWGGTYEVHLQPLFMLQKKVLRIITDSNYLEHTDPLFYKTNILKLSDIHNFLLAQSMFKCNIGNSLVTLNHNYNTRYRDNAVPSFQRLTVTQHSTFYTAPHVWNAIPIEIRDCKHFSKFKSMLKTHYIGLYLPH
jgi:hypothetical protein